MAANGQHGRTLSAKGFWLAVAALAVVRCLLTSFQMAYTWVGGAPLDDELMFRAANAISSGQWLGDYDYLTLSKSMFFPVWLALLHALHLPYLISGTLLWCSAALLAAFAFRPLWRGRGLTLAFFGALAFLPSSWASYTLRVYRDNIFPALCLFCFAGFAGAALRLATWKKGTPRPRLWPWLAAAGAGLACGYLNREDAGLFLLPFALAATLVMVVLAVGRRLWRALVSQVIPYVLLAVGVLTFCTLNQIHYGIFALSDFSTGAFADAMGAMMRVDTESTEPLLSVPADARQKLYEAVPALQPLEYWLEEDAQLQNDFRDPQLEDYRAGSFYWAIRRAAQFEGIYDNAQKAEDYWAEVADAINAACEDGTLPTRTGQRSSTTQPIRASYVAPVLAESLRSLVHVLNFADCDPAETLRSIGTEEDFAAWSGYLHCSFNGAAEAGKDTPYYSPLQKLVFAGMRLLRYPYAAFCWLGLILAVVHQIATLPGVLRRRNAQAVVPWLLLLGLLGMAALRCAMIAFVEVSSFGIGTSTMYLSTVHPLLLLFILGNGALWLTQRRNPHVQN